MSSVRVAIVGGGIAGASIAFHLAARGWRDILVVDQGDLVGGTTSHAPGLVGQLRSSASLTRMLMYSVALYRKLRYEGEPGFFEVGSLRLASSPARWQELQRQAAFARQVGLEARLVTPVEALELFPLMNLERVAGALFVPHDGSAAATVLTHALIAQAQAHGVRFEAHCAVRNIEVVSNQVRALETTHDRIAAEVVIIAAGIWSRQLARLAGVALPVVPLQHQYVVTDGLPELTGRTVPNLRDPDHRVYLRQHGDGLAVGGYETKPRAYLPDTLPAGVNPTVIPFDAAHFEPLCRAAAQRVPCLASAVPVRKVNGLEAFTPDGEFLFGPAAGMRGLWFACGFCAHGVSGAAGVGKVLADWLEDGDPGLDVSAMNPGRFGSRAADVEFVCQRACEVYRTYYDLREANPT